MNKRNVIITIISVLILTCIFAFARTTTTDLTLVKPTWLENIDILDDLNANSDLLEAFANDPLEFDSDLERLEDRAGAMWTGNTETGLTITYRDADNTIDAVIGANDIVESMLKAVNAPLDEEVFTYESTTGDFEWHTLAELSIQPLDAGLTSIAGLTTAANKMIYTTALDTYAVIDLTAFARTIIDDADASTVRTTLGLVIGTNVQAYDAGLLSLAGLTYASDSFIKVTATDVYAIRTIAETKTDLSLNNVTNDAQIAKSLGTTQGDIIYFTGSATPVRLAKGAATEVLTMNAGATAPEWAAGGAGYTNLTSFVDQTAWRVFYSNTDGDVVELALGADGTYLKSNGAAAAPTFATPAGAGDVVKVGTPADSQVGVWTGDGTIEGAATLTYDGANLQLTGDIGSTGTKITKGWFTDLTVTNAIAGSVTGNARGLVSVSNADIIIQPNGTGDTRIYAPADVVTTSSANNTLTIAEAGTVLVSNAHTETLPTASGHTGLRYHFIKTDANYDLITLDGNGAETFNHANDTSAPTATYLELNTYCAEVTIISDGTNWQVINEVIGQVPYAFVYVNTNQEDIPNTTWTPVELNTEDSDIGSNFDVSTWVSGNATSTSANHLVDSGGAFTSVMLGKRVKNTTDTTYAYITAVNSATDVTINLDIFVDTEGYEIKHAKFVVPIAGYYMIIPVLEWADGTVIADKLWYVGVRINGSTMKSLFALHSSNTSTFKQTNAVNVKLAKDDYIEMTAYHNAGAATPDIRGTGITNTNITIYLNRKEQ